MAGGGSIRSLVVYKLNTEIPIGSFEVRMIETGLDRLGYHLNLELRRAVIRGRHMWGFCGNSCSNLGAPSGVITACGWWVGLCKEDAKKSRDKVVPFLVRKMEQGSS